MKKIEDIIYHTTRGVIGVTDKLDVAVLFLYAFKHSMEALAELMYSKNTQSFIDKHNKILSDYGISLNVNMKDSSIREAVNLTIKDVRKHWDDEGFYKALYDRDPFAIACLEVAEAFEGMSSQEYDRMTISKIVSE